MPISARNRETCHDGNFPSTRWTLVQRVRMPGADATTAIEELCHHYWFPIYAFLRSRHHTKHDAEDLTQGFFQKLLADGLFQTADQDKGRLRSLLLAALKCFLADEARYDQAQKRGGGAPVISIEWARAEERYFAEPVDRRDPEKIYFATWARDLVERARQKLRATYGSGARTYLELESFLDEKENRGAYREAAARLNLTEVAIRVAVCRLRKRFAESVADEVRQTVDSPEEVKAELAWLGEVLRGG